MKRTKKKYGVRFCTFCEQKTAAEFMTSGLAEPIEYACEKHKTISEARQNEGES